MADSSAPIRKPIRLRPGAYLENGSVWLVTIGAADREHVFVDHDLAHDVANPLRERCDAMGADLYAYSLMPNHLHLLLQVGE